MVRALPLPKILTTPSEELVRPLVTILDEVLPGLDEAAKPRIVFIEKSFLGGCKAGPLEKLLGHQTEASPQLEAAPLRKDRAGDHDVVHLVLAPGKRSFLQKEP